MYWLMQAVEGRFRPTREIDEVRWLPLRDVLDLLSHQRDRTLLGALLAPQRLQPAR